MPNGSVGPVYDIAKRDLSDEKLYRLNRKFQMLWDQVSQIQQRLAALEKPVSGWSRPTGTISRDTFDQSTATTADVAQRLAALVGDLLDDNILHS